MPIVSITLKNFRSYAVEVVEQFNRRLNVVLGKNGEGKSNLLRALLFVLSDKVQFNPTERNNLFHVINLLAQKGLADGTKEDIEVEVVVDTNNRLPESDTGRVKLVRRWTADDKEEYVVDGKKCTKSQMASIVECLGLVYSNPYNIVQQGKIVQIAAMDDQEIYRLLEQSTGVRKYYQKRQDTLSNLTKVEKEKKEVEGLLADLEARLNAVFHSKEQFEAYENDNQNRKKRAAREVAVRLAELSRRLEAVKSGYLDAVKDADAILQRKQADSDELMQHRQRLKLITDKLMFYSSEAQQLPSIDLQLRGEPESQADEQAVRKVNAEEKMCKDKTLSSERALNEAKDRYESLKETYESMRMDCQMANNAQKEKLIEQSLLGYDEDIQSKKEAIEAGMKSINRLTKLIEKSTSQVSADQLNNQRSALDRLRQELMKYHGQLRDLKVRQVDTNRRINELQLEHQNSRELFERLWMRFSGRVGYLVNFDLMAELKRQRIRGIYGYLIDYLQINGDVSFAYDMANKNKFFALIVEDNAAVKEVLRINRELKGRQVNIYTLQNLRKEPLQHRRYPVSEDAYPLMREEWLKIDLPERLTDHPSDLLDNIRKLTNNILCKYMLVKDYSTALTLAKEYHSNCITADQEIVYADAYLCRVGREEHTSQSRLLSYQKLLRKKGELDSLLQAIERQNRQLDQLSNSEMQVVREERVVIEQLKTLELQYNALKQGADYTSGLQDQRKKLEEEVSLNRSELEKLERNREELLKKRDKKIVVPANFKAIETEHNSALSKYNELMQKHYTNEAELKSAIQRKIAILQRIADSHEDEENSKAAESMNPTNTLNKLRRDLKACEEHIRNLERSILKLNESHEQAEKIRNVTSEQMAAYEQEAEMLLTKKKELGVSEELMEEDIQDPVSELNDISNQNSLRRKYYTARDRVFFSKVASIRSGYEEFRKRMDIINRSEVALNEVIKMCDLEAAGSMESIVVRFQGHFQRIFQRIVPESSCQVTFQRHTERIRGNERTQNSLDIRVSFDRGVPQKKWTTFSGGEKTIIALTLVMAVQECDPAPFYVFDEVDSALDAIYRKRIAQLLEEKSRSAQYILTSFKPEMTEFEDCSYFEVSSQDRRSHVKPISQERAQRLMEVLEQLN